MNDQSETIAALRRRVDHLQTRCEEAEKCALEATDLAEKTQADNKELLMRAMRYQFLRDRPDCGLLVMRMEPATGESHATFIAVGQGEDLDAAVDREIDMALAAVRKPS